MLPNSAWFTWFEEVFGTQGALEPTAACCAAFLTAGIPPDEITERCI